MTSDFFSFPAPLARRLARLKKQYVIYLAAFMMSISLGTLALGMVFYVRSRFEASPSQIGFMAACFMMTYIFGCVCFRPLYKMVHPGRLITTSLSGASAAALWFYLSPSITSSYFAYGLLGLSVSIFWSPLLGWLSSGGEEKTLGRVVSRFNLSWSSGTIIAPFMAGGLSQINPSLPVLVSVVFFFSNLAFIVSGLLFLPALKKPLESGEEEKKREVSTGADKETFLRYPGWAGVIASFALVTIILNIFPVYANEVLGISKSHIGVLLFLRALFGTLAFLILGKWTFWQFSPRIIVGTHALLLVLTALMVFATDFLTIALMLSAQGFVVSVSYAVSQFHGVAGAANKAARTAVHEGLLAVGCLFGPWIGGIILERTSMNTVWAACCCMLALLVVLQIQLCAIARRREGRAAYGKIPKHAAKQEKG